MDGATKSSDGFPESVPQHPKGVVFSFCAMAHRWAMFGLQVGHRTGEGHCQWAVRLKRLKISSLTHCDTQFRNSWLSDICPLVFG